MIAKLTGLVDGVGADGCVIDVNGVGYQAFASRRPLDRLGRLATGQPAVLQVETHVREDHIHLFGFIDYGRARVVPVVDWRSGRRRAGCAGDPGRPRIPTGLSLAIVAQDKALLTEADGVGPKLAGRIVSELKDKAGAGPLGASTVPGVMPLAEAAVLEAEGGPSADAISALVNLGYGRTDAVGAVAAATRQIGGTPGRRGA